MFASEAAQDCQVTHGFQSLERWSCVLQVFKKTKTTGSPVKLTVKSEIDYTDILGVKIEQRGGKAAHDARKT